MKKFICGCALATVCILAFGAFRFLLPVYRITTSESNDMQLSGTSTMHEWTMQTSIITGEAQFTVLENIITKINVLNFSLPVENLKSHEKAMDRNAYKALKTNQFKNITFNLTSAKPEPLKDNRQAVRATGNLSVAGVKKEIELVAFCQVNKDQSITCKGSKKLSMKHFDVTPPEFLFGAMKTGDEITLDFNLTFKQ